MAQAPSVAVESATPHPATAPQRVTIVIPAYNEEGGIGAVLTELRRQLPAGVAEVVVVDDGSTDRTAEIAEAAGVRVLRHPINKGYGASLKTAIKATTSEYVLTMDADGQHRLEDVAALCAAVSGENPPDCERE